MRLVGATDTFIKVPYYLEGLIQGFAGSLIGLGLLYAAFSAVGAQFQQTLSAEMISIRFLPLTICGWIIGGGMMTGLLGSFFSLKQFMKR